MGYSGSAYGLVIGTGTGRKAARQDGGAALGKIAPRCLWPLQPGGFQGSLEKAMNGGQVVLASLLQEEVPTTDIGEPFQPKCFLYHYEKDQQCNCFISQGKESCVRMK